MKSRENTPVRREPDGLIRCALCRHFSYFESKAGHNSPHALGRCAAEPWDGSRGQWPMLQHPCRNFEKIPEGG